MASIARSFPSHSEVCVVAQPISKDALLCNYLSFNFCITFDATSMLFPSLLPILVFSLPQVRNGDEVGVFFHDDEQSIEGVLFNVVLKE